MIYGIGHDVLEIERIAKLMNRGLGVKFIRRVLTAREHQLAERRNGKQAEFVAGRFAAKEAVVKALGCGIGRSVGFHDIEILPDKLGKPEVVLLEAAWERLNMPEGREYTIHLTITHGRDLASAFAVVEQVASI
ncbi:holo-ACP synthase [Paenibacillus monticola]|uniref:Holo-[acyl-carrier-protein] synthase n=1 Tax=Paenibacillus monticola TaxID=2666075 RepID=A0A7X2H8S4_9BACL|nr:holo-ACP synthase [Paenibacillus monticola]MRN55543.1 holo-[acyl-carrier-protein] synthase [Paenibacillus monticola]